MSAVLGRHANRFDSASPIVVQRVSGLGLVVYVICAKVRVRVIARARIKSKEL